jgi:hypothetical protein
MKTFNITILNICQMLAMAMTLFFIGCYQTRSLRPEVVIYPDSIFMYKLQFIGHVKGLGNLHNMDLKYYEYDNSQWIYVSKRIGIMDSSQFVFTRYPGKPEQPWIMHPLKGFVELTIDSVYVGIQLPYYEQDGYLSHWTEWEWNGKHKLKIDTTIPAYKNIFDVRLPNKALKLME